MSMMRARPRKVGYRTKTCDRQGRPCATSRPLRWGRRRPWSASHFAGSRRRGRKRVVANELPVVRSAPITSADAKNFPPSSRMSPYFIRSRRDAVEPRGRP
jgi:hypothetical protein